MTKTTDELSAHPLSELFPRMDKEELDTLAEDIKANELKEAIWLFEDKILDGNNRYSAGLKIGYRFKETDFRQFDPKVHGDPLAFVVSQNLHRRHLTESQRAAIAATLVNTKLGSNQFNRASITNEKAAKMLGVSVATVKTAKDIAQKAASEIQELVRKGDLRLGAAKELLTVPKEQQLAELAKKKAEKEKEKEKQEKANNTSTKSKEKSKANQAMKDVDDFCKKWKAFDNNQRQAFVGIFRTELAALLDAIQQREAMIGAAA
jgi:ParB-like chromosome segregation protein Spo0J